MKYLKTFESLHKTLEEIIDEVKSSSYFNFLECDGCTRVLSYLLKKNGIKHTCYYGYASLDNRQIVHWWIKVNGKILDLKIKMWMGDKAVEGLFTESETPVKYKGQIINMDVDDITFKVLTM